MSFPVHRRRERFRSLPQGGCIEARLRLAGDVRAPSHVDQWYAVELATVSEMNRWRRVRATMGLHSTLADGLVSLLLLAAALLSIRVQVQAEQLSDPSYRLPDMLLVLFVTAAATLSLMARRRFPWLCLGSQLPPSSSPGSSTAPRTTSASLRCSWRRIPPVCTGRRSADPGCSRSSLARSRWSLPDRYASNDPVNVSPSRRQILHRTGSAFVLWRLPEAPEDLAAWLDELTNATVDRDGQLTWPWQTP